MTNAPASQPLRVKWLAITNFRAFRERAEIPLSSN
jgi:hypothetical protein